MPGRAGRTASPSTAPAASPRATHPVARLYFAGLPPRKIGSTHRPCAVWRCPAGHEHWRLHVRIGSSTQPAAEGPVWEGVPVRERLERVEPWELTRAQREAEEAREREAERLAREAWRGPPRAVCVEAVSVLPVWVAAVEVRGWPAAG